MLDQRLVAYTMPNAPEGQKTVFGKARFTVLAPELIRFEYDEKGVFCDEATQIVWFRNLKECPYTVKRDEEKRLLLIVTEKATFIYNEREAEITTVELGGKFIPCDNSGNLEGTARTLDQSFGPVKLGGGVISRTGVSVIEDNSLILQKNGEVGARPREKDKYIFASKDYRRVLSLFYAITGKPPMVPRYSLGCWWSRYEKYTQDGYMQLMDRFIAEDIPITVATIDMDWHWVNLKKDVGFTKWQGAFIVMNGWTGYSWNTKLFPDYKQFLKDLHSRNLAVTLNLHPAAGVRSFETQYGEMCAATGTDPAKKKQIKFDITSPKFLNAYFSVLHKPYEREGVDFWWIDWQQGTKSKLKGYDPLWACNHYHSLDAAEDGKRPLILSRYAGLGSHRYPLGFSGDTAILWKVLNFQPYFTANAANAGYTAWSHDIGGHMGSPSNDELYLRWIQFGVFTPVMRLHSTRGIKGKEPWNHPAVEEETKAALRFRHRLIPYIYTAYYNNWKFGRAICEPLYYAYPQEENAYKYRNQYNFGGSLIVAPVTSAGKTEGNEIVSETAVWLPEGRYTDIFTGERLSGGECVVKRNLSSVPVFAKDGSIIPLANVSGNFSGNPDDMELLVFAGNGGYCLYEDDGISMNYQADGGASTCFEVSEEKEILTFRKLPADGDASFVPKNRTYRLKLYNAEYSSAEARLNGKPFDLSTENGIIILKDIKPADKVEIILKK